MYLTTKELEKYIREKINFLNETSIGPHYFDDKTNGNEGVYVYSNWNGYHYVYSERGSETTHKITDSVFEITFWVLYSIVSQLAYRSVPEDVKNSSDPNAYRRFAFNKIIELLGKIGENFKKAGELAVEETLRRAPYE